MCLCPLMYQCVRVVCVCVRACTCVVNSATDALLNVSRIGRYLQQTPCGMARFILSRLQCSVCGVHCPIINPN